MPEWGDWEDYGNIYGLGHIAFGDPKPSRKKKHPLGFAPPKESIPLPLSQPQKTIRKTSANKKRLSPRKT